MYASVLLFVLLSVAVLGKELAVSLLLVTVFYFFCAYYNH